MSTQNRLGRRKALVGIGAATVGAAAVPLAARGLSGSPVDSDSAPPSSSAAEPLAAADPPVRALFGSLREGSPVSTHWRLEKVHAVRAGAIPVVMSTIYGGRFAVEIFRDDVAGPPPIARSRGLALYLVNGGDGSSQTSELAGLGVMALARELDETRLAGASTPRGLATYADRMAREPDGVFDVPLV